MLKPNKEYEPIAFHRTAKERVYSKQGPLETVEAPWGFALLIRG